MNREPKKQAGDLDIPFLMRKLKPREFMWLPIKVSKLAYFLDKICLQVLN